MGCDNSIMVQKKINKQQFLLENDIQIIRWPKCAQPQFFQILNIVIDVQKRQTGAKLATGITTDLRQNLSGSRGNRTISKGWAVLIFPRGGDDQVSWSITTKIIDNQHYLIRFRLKQKVYQIHQLPQFTPINISEPKIYDFKKT